MQSELTPFELGRVILVDKPLKWTSFQAVNRLKWLIRSAYGLKKIKVGHAGTLDPLATGLLIICTGKYTKDIESFQAKDKVYSGEITLGASTPCFDLEKPIDAYYPIDHIQNDQILATARSFIGQQDQYPPIFSAVKIQGERAYNYARKDQTVEMQAKSIRIDRFDITDIDLPRIRFCVHCSKGTYIRSLAKDFGERLQSGAHLSALRREAIGSFSVDKAIKNLEQISIEELLQASQRLS